MRLYEPNVVPDTDKVTLQRVVLERFDFYAAAELDEPFVPSRFDARASVEREANIATLGDRVAVRLAAGMFGRLVWQEKTGPVKERTTESQEVVDSVQVPVSLWDHFKQRCVPKRFQRGLLAPRLRTIETTLKKTVNEYNETHRHFKLAPRLFSRSPDERHHLTLTWLAQDGSLYSDVEQALTSDDEAEALAWEVYRVVNATGLGITSRGTDSPDREAFAYALDRARHTIARKRSRAES